MPKEGTGNENDNFGNYLTVRDPNLLTIWE
jgi:hypothetical protein